jgi:dipeptidase E
MNTLYLLGGENTLKQNARQVNQQAFLDAGDKPVVLVISWAKPSFDLSFERTKRLRLYFMSLGASRIHFLDYSDTQQQISEKLLGSNLVYLTGGQTSILLERLKTKKVDTLLKNFDGIIVGRSAGALALCKGAVVTDRYTKKIKITQGLAMAKLTAKVHYKLSQDDLLNSLSIKDKIYAIPQRSSIICNGEILSVIGKAYFFENQQKHRLQ